MDARKPPGRPTGGRPPGRHRKPSQPRQEGMRFANFYSGVTKGLKRVPWLDQLIVSDSAAEEGWTVLKQLSAEDVANLPKVEFAGDKKGWLNRLPIPRFYKKLGALAFEAADANEGKPALVAIFGKTAVMAVLGEGVGLTADPENPRRRLIGARIGHEALTVAAGTFDEEHGFRATPVEIYGEGRPEEFAPPPGLVTV